MRYLVFSADPSPVQVSPLPAGLQFMTWRPSIRSLIPPGMSMRFVMWSFMHFLRVFRNRHFSVTYIMEGGAIVHWSCVLPAYFRWPFMAKNDLQVNSTYTNPHYRGRGLATIALQQILSSAWHETPKFWYVTRENNPASISVCKKVGFSLFGRARRTTLLGIRVLGRLVIYSDVTDGEFK